jgi:mRNA interferase MazF
VAAYCPDAGDIIWLDFLQAVANEQAGRRPALVLSPLAFNELTGWCIACPITRRDRDWSFHVSLPDSDEISGVVQADQLRSASWEQRGSRFIAKKLQQACLTKYEPGSSRCSRFDRFVQSQISVPFIDGMIIEHVFGTSVDLKIEI